jgi:hypothetical protein
MAEVDSSLASVTLVDSMPRGELSVFLFEVLNPLEVFTGSAIGVDFVTV